MRRFLLFLICIFCFINCFSQKRYNVWCFGDRAGLDFNNNPPTAFNSSVINQAEGCAIVCDNTTGQLLFFTDGIKIWNRNKLVMPNGTGLFGGGSSTQSAIIIQKPGDNNTYYVFTVPQQNANHPLSYSIVDMTLDGGLGAVTTKNVALHTPVTEKLTATLNSNGTDYWIVAKEFGTDAFVTYSVTAAGVNSNPVISHAGYVPTHVNDNIGYARISHNGSKFCIAYWYSDISQLLDFDNSTGILSNPVDLPVIPSEGGPYGIEFSPDDSKLYIMQQAFYIIKQYNLLAGSATDIQNSAVEIAHTPFSFVIGGALMQGPDNKIYVSDFNRPGVSVIDQPNLVGAACNYIPGAVQLIFGTHPQLGLPNNINYPSSAIPCSPSQNISNNVSICSNQTYQLPSGTIVSTPGIYMDTIKSINSCDSIITTLNLSVFPVSILNTDVHICSNQTYQLPSGTIVSVPGIYSDTIRSIASCDSVINTMHVFVNDISSSNIVDSITDGGTYVLPSGQTVHSPGIYQTVLLNSIGCDSVITTNLVRKQQLLNCLTLKNAITPNGDGINDYWILYDGNCFKRMEVDVIDRFGNLVYHSGDYKNDWCGKYKNKELPDGTYYYAVKVISFDGRELVFKDNVTILR